MKILKLILSIFFQKLLLKFIGIICSKISKLCKNFEENMKKIQTKFMNFRTWKNFRIKYEDSGDEFFKNCEKNLQQFQEKLRQFLKIVWKTFEKNL